MHMSHIDLYVAILHVCGDLYLFFSMDIAFYLMIAQLQQFSA